MSVDYLVVKSTFLVQYGVILLFHFLSYLLPENSHLDCNLIDKIAKLFQSKLQSKSPAILSSFHGGEGNLIHTCSCSPQHVKSQRERGYGS